MTLLDKQGNSTRVSTLFSPSSIKHSTEANTLRTLRSSAHVRQSGNPTLLPPPPSTLNPNPYPSPPPPPRGGPCQAHRDEPIGARSVGTPPENARECLHDCSHLSSVSCVLGTARWRLTTRRMSMVLIQDSDPDELRWKRPKNSATRS